MKNMLRYAIVEDNPFALENLKMMVERLRRDWQLVFTGGSISAVASFLQGGAEVDLIFLDIELSDGKCFELFERVHTTVPVIFTTAYDDYAIKAFKVNGVDYLLKPVSEKELAYAIDKFENLHLSSPAEAPAPRPAADTGRLLTVSGDSYGYVDIEDVDYFLSEDNYVFALLKQGGRKLINIPNLRDLEAVLPSKQFFRISRSVIVSISSITGVSKYFKGRLLVQAGRGEAAIEVSVTASRRDAFLEWFGR